MEKLRTTSPTKRQRAQHRARLKANLTKQKQFAEEWRIKAEQQRLLRS